MKIFLSLAVSALALVAACAQAAELTIIELQHRTADDLLPALRPLVGTDTALSGVDYKLLVRGSASEVARIREVVAVLDSAPRQLMISVRYSATPQSKSGTIGAGTGNNNGSNIVVRGGVVTSTASDTNVSQVRVVEGNGVHIATGQSVPMVTAVMVGSRSRSIGVATDYRELTSGFAVMPRVNGNRVILDIATQQQRATNLGQGQATVQRANTTIAGRLGEWIELGGVTENSSEQKVDVGAGGGARRVTTQSDQRSIMVKVEQVD